MVYICSKMLKREYFIIYHNYYNLPVASPCLQTPDWGLRTRQQVSSSSWLQEVSRSQAARLRPAYSFLRHQPHSSAASGFSTFCQQSKARKQCVQAVYRCLSAYPLISSGPLVFIAPTIVCLFFSQNIMWY